MTPHQAIAVAAAAEVDVGVAHTDVVGFGSVHALAVGVVDIHPWRDEHLCTPS